MKLPEGMTVYQGGRRYKNEVPEKIFGQLKKSTQEKIEGKKPKKFEKKEDK